MTMINSVGDNKMNKEQAKLLREEIEKERTEFCDILEKIIPRLKKEIEEIGTIIVSVKELKSEMRGKYEHMHITRFYYGAKLCLFDNGIYIEPRKKDTEPALSMRFLKEDDKLFKNAKNSLEEQIARDIMITMIYANPKKLNHSDIFVKEENN